MLLHITIKINAQIKAEATDLCKIFIEQLNDEYKLKYFQIEEKWPTGFWGLIILKHSESEWGKAIIKAIEISRMSGAKWCLSDLNIALEFAIETAHAKFPEFETITILLRKDECSLDDNS